MKRILVAAVILAGAVGAAFAQSGTVTLQNEENAPFYYLVDPADLAGLTPGSPLLSSRVASFFAAAATAPSFNLLAAGSDAVLASLTDGSHLVVGFFAVQDLEDFPVRVFSVQADSRVQTRFYAVFASPAQLTVRRATGRLAAFTREAGALAGAAAGAASTGPAGMRQIATFSAGYDPVAFTRETSTGLSVLPIADSRAWSTTGTRIASISGVRDSSGLRFAISVPRGFSEKVSYMLYFFPRRTSGSKDTLALEVEPRASGDRGACILWRADATQPSIVGDVSTTDDTVQVTIDAQDLAAQITPQAGDAPTIDLTSAWYDRALGAWEEFYFATFAMTDIAVRR